MICFVRFGKDAAIQWTPADIDWKREVNRA